MVMPGRKFEVENGYRYGFNRKENDKDISESGQDYGMRIYDGRLGRFLSVDPITKNFPELTPYQFASNSPIANLDMDGNESIYYTIIFTEYYDSKGKLQNVTAEIVCDKQREAEIALGLTQHGDKGTGMRIDLVRVRRFAPDDHGVVRQITENTGWLYIKSAADKAKEKNSEGGQKWDGNTWDGGHWGGVAFYSKDGEGGRDSRKGAFDDLQMVEISALLRFTHVAVPTGILENSGEINDDMIKKRNKQKSEKVTEVPTTSPSIKKAPDYWLYKRQRYFDTVGESKYVMSYGKDSFIFFDPGKTIHSGDSKIPDTSKVINFKYPKKSNDHR